MNDAGDRCLKWEWRSGRLLLVAQEARRGLGVVRSRWEYGGLLPLTLFPTAAPRTLPVTGFREIRPEGAPPTKVGQPGNGISGLSV